MPKNNDLLLLDAYKSDPKSGFKAIIEKYQERIYWQIRRMTQNHQDTEDVMQNVFIKVWKSLDKFEGKSALYSWLYRIAYNETITHLNKANKLPISDLDGSLIENSIVVEGKSYSGDEISHILNKAIETLPEKQAQVFNLRYFDDLKYKEISDLLNTSVGGLKASYHIAVKKIEEFIKAY